MSGLYRTGKLLLAPVLRAGFRLRVDGAENIPAEGGFVLCCNHRSVYDPCLLAAACPRPIRFMAKSELFEEHGKAVKKLLLALDAFPVRRDSGDAEAVRTAVSVLKEGGVLGIFPQGRCVPEGVPFQAKAGAALIAEKARVPVLPACVSCQGPLRPLSRAAIRFGTAIPYAELFPDGARKRVREASRKIEEQINLLLEEKV